MTQHINLYQSGFRRRKKPFAVRSMALALGLVVAACVLLYAQASYEARKAEALAQGLAGRIASQQQQLKEMTAKDAPGARSRLLENELARLESQVASRRSVLSALGAGSLGNTDGFSEVFAGFGRQAMSGVWLVGLDLADAGARLHVRARALKPELVPAYLKALGAEAMMEGRRVGELKIAARSVADAAPNGPHRFVEFEFSAPRGAEPADPGKVP